MKEHMYVMSSHHSADRYDDDQDTSLNVRSFGFDENDAGGAG